MKKKGNDNLRPEYDFSALKRGTQGKYARRYRSGTNIVHLDPDVALVFGSDESVNRVLRSLIKLAKTETAQIH